MFKKVLLVVLFLIFSNQLFSDSLDTEEFKFLMDIPEGFVFETYEDEQWGGIIGEDYESGTILYALSYLGETDPEEVYKYAVSLSLLEESYWIEYDSGEGDGFLWWAQYSAENEEYEIHAIFGQSEYEDISYIFYIIAPVESFELYQEDYISWLESVDVIN